MVGFPKRFKHRHTVRFGKVQIEHDQVEGFDGEQVDGRLPIMAAIDAIGKMAKAAGRLRRTAPFRPRQPKYAYRASGSYVLFLNADFIADMITYARERKERQIVQNTEGGFPGDLADCRGCHGGRRRPSG